MADDIPVCDICAKNDATSVEDGIYRCEDCETAHQRLDAQEERLAEAIAHDHFAAHEQAA